MFVKREKLFARAGIPGLVLTGALGMYHSFHTGTGLGLIASAISFGVILIVSFL